MGQKNRHPFCWLVVKESKPFPTKTKKRTRRENAGRHWPASPQKGGTKKNHRAVQRAASCYGRTARLRFPPHGRPAAGRPTLLRQSPRPGALPAAFGAVSADFFRVEAAGFGSVVFEAISTFEYSLLGPLKKLSISSKQRDPSGMGISKPEPSTCARGPLHGSLSREQPLNLEPRSNKPPP